MLPPRFASRLLSCLAAATFLAPVSPRALAQAAGTTPALPPSSTNAQPAAPAQQTAAPQTATPPTAASPTQTSPTQTSPTQTSPAQTGTPTPPADAQQQPEASGNGAFTLRTFVPEVDLVFTVTDGKGHFVTGLKQSDLGLLDDGKRPDRVISFTQQANLPLRIGILLDTSNSIRSRFQFEQQAATEFLLQVLRPRQDAAFITGFDVRLDLAQDYTNSIDKLSTAIEKLRPGGGTAFFDAIYQTCRDQMLTVKSNETLRKAIIVVSDGEDNYSRVYEQDAIKECQRAETIVYTISTNVSPSRSKGDDVLTRLSDATGGRAFFPTKIEDVANGFRAIEEELRSQYSLRYRPADLKQDGAFRSIYLVSIDQRYHVRALKGYFAPRPPR